MSKRSRRGFAEGFKRNYRFTTPVAGQLDKALTPQEPRGANLKTLKDMSPAEKAELERLYGAKIKEPKR